MLNDLAELIAIESVMGAPQPHAPFGTGPRAALDWFLQKAKDFGLSTGELDGYCGWAEYGTGDSCIGILAHLDVVPADPKGWSNPPFRLAIENGRAYGRGVADDKGPTVVCLHMLKRLKDERVPLKHRIRLIVGCNEENGSACMKHYRKHGEIPVVSLTPDSDFPVINSEKTIKQVHCAIPCDAFFADNVAAVTAGVRPNVVPSSASVTLKESAVAAKIRKATGGDLSKLFRLPAVLENLVTFGFEGRSFGIVDDNGLTLTADGVAGHASEPEKGVNALAVLCAVLEPLFEGKSATLKAMNEYLLSPLAPEKLGIAVEDASGALTMNVGTAAFDGKTLTLSLDFRVPASFDADRIEPAVAARIGDCKFETIQFTKSLFIPEQSPLVQTLLKVYTKVTGNEGYTVKTGGGTYARELPNAIAYGPTFPGEETAIHNVDESIAVEHLFHLGDIYFEAVKALDTLY